MQQYEEWRGTFFALLERYVSFPHLGPEGHSAIIVLALISVTANRASDILVDWFGVRAWVASVLTALLPSLMGAFVLGAFMIGYTALYGVDNGPPPALNDFLIMGAMVTPLLGLLLFRTGRLAVLTVILVACATLAVAGLILVLGGAF